MTERLFPAVTDENNTQIPLPQPNLRLILVAGIITFIVAIIFINFVLIIPHAKSQSALSNAVSLLHTKLNDIQTEISTITAQALPSPDLQRTMTTMSQEVAALKQSVAQLAADRDLQTLATSIGEVKTDVDTQMNDLKKLVADQRGVQHLINPKSLPFQVLSVDVIAGQSLLSINYQHQVMPLLVGDSLAGWQVVKISFDHQAAELKNNHGDVVVVTA